MAIPPTEETSATPTRETEPQSVSSIIQDPTIIRQLSEDFIQLADRSQDAIYQFDIESQTFPYEFCITDKEGHTKWILETSTSIQYKGKRAALCYFMDISQGKKAEQDRVAKEKLLSVLELAGAVGHELNNPLQVVLTCTEKLSPGIDENARQTRLYQLLKNNVDRLQTIIQKFQNITRYATKEYVDGKKIRDIEASSSSEGSGGGVPTS